MHFRSRHWRGIRATTRIFNVVYCLALETISLRFGKQEPDPMSLRRVSLDYGVKYRGAKKAQVF